MLSDQKKATLLKYILRGLIPPGVAAVQKSYIKDDFSILIRIMLIDGTGVYGMVDANDNIWLLSAWEWLERAGIEVIAHEYGIKTVEAIE